MRYARDLPLKSTPAQVLEVEHHIRAHLSAVTTEDDNPQTRAAEVAIDYRAMGDQLRVTGQILGEPTAAYLREDWTPEQDIADNPLSVPSIEAS
jgi:hydrogenase maturation factor HypF (carbamoyltransferase family)